MVLKITNLHILRYLPAYWLYLLERYTIDNQQCTHTASGTSVNPARSIGPALFQGGEALSQLWLFIVAPFVGAALSAVVWKVLAAKEGK